LCVYKYYNSFFFAKPWSSKIKPGRIEMKKTARCSLFVVLFLVCSVIVVASASAVMPVPTSNLILPPYTGVTVPVLSDNPAIARPVGLGPVAVGGNILTVQIGLNQFSGPVDIYGAFILSTNPTIVNVLKPGGGFNQITLTQVLVAIQTGIVPPGVSPWMSGVTGPISQTLVNTSLSNIPSGGYSVYLLVTPTGTFNDFYLWITAFANL
jgi:hypothetical protein